MAVCFCSPIKSDLFSARLYGSVTFYMVPEKQGHVFSGRVVVLSKRSRWGSERYTYYRCPCIIGIFLENRSDGNGYGKFERCKLNCPNMLYMDISAGSVSKGPNLGMNKNIYTEYMKSKYVRIYIWNICQARVSR